MQVFWPNLLVNHYHMTSVGVSLSKVIPNSLAVKNFSPMNIRENGSISTPARGAARRARKYVEGVLKGPYNSHTK